VEASSKIFSPAFLLRRKSGTTKSCKIFYASRFHIYAAEVSQFIVQSGAAPTISRLEQTWHEVKADLHAEIHYKNADNVVMGQWRQELFARGSSRPGMR